MLYIFFIWGNRTEDMMELGNKEINKLNEKQNKKRKQFGK